MNQTVGRIAQINVSQGGVPKRPVASARVHWLGLEGDVQRNLQVHGGPDRAVCLYSMEQIQLLRDEGHPVEPGWLGENVTTAGVDLATILPCDRVLLGQDVILEITRHTSPCVNIAGAFRDGQILRVSQQHFPGSSRVYARVLREGMIGSGDTVRLVAGAECSGATALPPMGESGR